MKSMTRLSKVLIAACPLALLGSPMLHHDTQAEPKRRAFDQSDQSDQFPVTHGVSVGDVTDSTAVIWSRTNHDAIMHVSVQGKKAGKPKHRSVRVNADHDFTGKIFVRDLKPDTPYAYVVWFSDRGGRRSGQTAKGRFRTAPARDQAKAVSLAFGGDLAGQNVCRDAQEGFPIFDAINQFKPDLFIGLCDMIYADNTCGPVGRYGNAQVPGDFEPAANLKDYWAHWKYNRGDRGLRKLLHTTSYANRVFRWVVCVGIMDLGFWDRSLKLQQKETHHACSRDRLGTTEERRVAV